MGGDGALTGSGARAREARRTTDGAAPHLAPPTTRALLFDLLPIALAAFVVAGLYLYPYARGIYREPIGWDVAHYLDQTKLIAAHGFAGASHLKIPTPSLTITNRVGFPVSVLALSKLFGTSTFTVAGVISIAGAVALALAVAGFLSIAFGLDRWKSAVVAIVVGVSPALTRMMAGTYTDNLLAGAVLLASLVPLLSVARDGRGFIATITLLGVAGLIHPPFFEFMALVLLGVAALFLPGSWREWRREGRSPWSTPTGRIGTAVLGAGALAGGVAYAAFRESPASPVLSRNVIEERYRRDVGLYLFPVTLPLGAAGAKALTDPGVVSSKGRADRPFGWRFGVSVLVAWVAVTAFGVAAYFTGLPIPIHRFLAFLIPLPILVALGVLWVSRILARGNGRRAVAITSVAVAGFILLGYFTLYGTLQDRGLQWVDEGKVKDAVTAAQYLDQVGIPPSEPVVFILDDNGPQPNFFVPEEALILRASLPLERTLTAHFYMGTAESFLAGKPTQRPGERQYNSISLRFWRTTGPVVPRHPVALALSSFTPEYERLQADHPEWLVAPNVIAVQGPKPPAALRPPFPPTAPFGMPRVGAMSLGMALALVSVGLGWVLALLPRGLRPFQALALSGALGIAFIVAVGTVVDFLGFRLGGAAGVAVVPLAAALGWSMAWVRHRRVGRPHDVLDGQPSGAG